MTEDWTMTGSIGRYHLNGWWKLLDKLPDTFRAQLFLAVFHSLALLFKFFSFISIAFTTWWLHSGSLEKLFLFNVLMALLLTDTQFPQFGWVCMGQKRNRESDWKILVLKTMQIPTEYNCNFICFIMPHYPPRPLMSRPGGSALCLPCAVSFRGGLAPFYHNHTSHKWDMQLAGRSLGPQSGVVLRVVLVI